MSDGGFVPLANPVDPEAGYGRTEWEPLGAAMPSDLGGPVLLVGTRKGLWLLAADRARTAWAMMVRGEHYRPALTKAT